MKYIALILYLSLIPTDSYASNKKTIIVEKNKKMTHKQSVEVRQSVKKGKCRKAIDPKTKKQYYVCDRNN